jgi:hypothetical protein
MPSYPSPSRKLCQRNAQQQLNQTFELNVYLRISKIARATLANNTHHQPAPINHLLKTHGQYPPPMHKRKVRLTINALFIYAPAAEASITHGPPISAGSPARPVDRSIISLCPYDTKRNPGQDTRAPASSRNMRIGGIGGRVEKEE